MAEALPPTIPHVAAAAARRWPDAVALIEGGDKPACVVDTISRYFPE